MKKSIRVLTYGGLGNQLFQLFYALCVTYDNQEKRTKVVLASGLESRFKMPRDFELQWAVDGGLASKSALNLVERKRWVKKLRRRYPHFEKGFRLFGTRYLDGYFQDEKFYKSFSKSVVTEALESMRRSLPHVKSNHTIPRLCHVRLGDFFSGEASARDFLENKVRYDDDTSFLTDDEQLLLEVYPKANLIHSRDKSAIDVLHIMMSGETIETNNSTLAFWAAVLGKRKLSSGSNHMKLFSRFLEED